MTHSIQKNKEWHFIKLLSRNAVKHLCIRCFLKEILEIQKNILYNMKQWIILFHIKFIYDIKDKILLKKKNIICEIGGGYGSMIGKLIKLHNSKVILIDLPEANFISHYLLKKLFPKKKFI